MKTPNLALNGRTKVQARNEAVNRLNRFVTLSKVDCTTKGEFGTIRSKGPTYSEEVQQFVLDLIAHKSLPSNKDQLCRPRGTVASQRAHLSNKTNQSLMRATTKFRINRPNYMTALRQN